MPVKKVFFDGDGNQLDCYPNDKGDLYIGIDNDENAPYANYITLKKSDVEELIKLLQEYKEDINEE